MADNRPSRNTNYVNSIIPDNGNTYLHAPPLRSIASLLGGPFGGCAFNNPDGSVSRTGDNPVPDFPYHDFRKHAVYGAVEVPRVNRTYIGAWPFKGVGFGEDNP